MKALLKNIIFILILGSILTSFLLLVDEYTKPIIKKNKEIKIKESILNVFEIPFSKNNINSVYSANIEERSINNKTFYISKDGSVGFKFKGSGLWGPIEGIIALDKDLKTIKNIVIIHEEETPGLGSRIKEREFLDKNKNKKFSPIIEIIKGKENLKENQVDTITGATLSCKSFEKILNDSYEMYFKNLQELKE